MTPRERALEKLKQGDVLGFYQSRAWRNKRHEIVLRDNRECQHCKKKGKVTTESLEVHHIKFLKTRPDLALDNNNLITVCTSCHNKAHPEKLEEFKEKKEPLNEERW